MNSPLVLAADLPALPNGARLLPPTPAAAPSLKNCLLLAALLHLWLVALVGTAPGGGAEPGESVWSSIQIRLGGTGPADSPGRAEAPLPNSGPLGRAPEPRFGGTVRDAPARPSPEPGAAALGEWNPRALPSPPGSPAAPAQAPIDPAPLAAPPPVLTRSPRQAAERRQEPALPAAASPTLPEPTPRPALEATPAPSTAPRLAPVDTVEAPVLERPAQSLRDIANPAPTLAPATRPLPAPAPQRDERATAPAPLMPRPPVQPARPLPLPEATAPVAAPVPLTLPPTPAPALPPTPIAAPAPPAREAAAPQPVPPPESPAPPATAPPEVATPAPPPAPPTFAVEPRPAPRVAPLSPVDVSQSQRVAPPDLALPPVRAPEPAAAAATAAPTSPAAIPSARDSLLPVAPPVSSSGPPGAGPRLGSERALAPSASASAATLNLDLPRARAPLPGLVSPRVLNLVPAPPERKSALTEGIEKAAKPDCRKAYAGLGVLAAVPLAADALRDGGCRW